MIFNWMAGVCFIPFGVKATIESLHAFNKKAGQRACFFVSDVLGYSLGPLRTGAGATWLVVCLAR